jgi:ABC-type hemin transport system, ATPase component
MANPVLEVRQASVTLDGVERLREVSFSLTPGEMAVIIGPNGAGKTSLLRLVAGELAASAGTVYLAGKESVQWSLAQRARQFAVLPQTSSLNFPFTVAEVVALGRSPHSTGQQLDAEIVAAALDAVDMTHLRDRLYTHLSGGEKQRAHLARVMAQIWRAEDAGERLLLLDEPTASLDLGHQQQLMQRVRDFAAQGVAVLLVLHDLNLALSFADRLLVLQEGRLIADGPSAEVLSPELLRRLFGASAELFHHPRTGRPIVLL